MADYHKSEATVDITDTVDSRTNMTGLKNILYEHVASLCNFSIISRMFDCLCCILTLCAKFPYYWDFSETVFLFAFSNQ